VRTGSWKAVQPFGGALELYNLDQDPAETRNVAAECEEIVKAIKHVMKTAHGESTLFPLREPPVPKSSIGQTENPAVKRLDGKDARG
jgi:hypothetical protein